MSAQSKPRYSIGTYWINDFSNGSGDEELEYSDDKALGFARVMKSEGHCWKFDFDSKSANARQFISWKDSEGNPFDDGEKHGGVDCVNFAFLSTHGGVRFSEPAGNILYYFIAAFGSPSPDVNVRAFNYAGNPRYSFKSRAIWVNRTAKLGDKNLRWLVLDSCESMQLPGYVESRHMELDIDPINTWFNVFYGINMIFGFTGYSYSSSWNDDMGSDFAECICDDDPLGESWTDEAYSYWLDNFPVSLAVGRDETDAKKRLKNDRLSKPVSKMTQTDIGWCAWNYRK